MFRKSRLFAQQIIRPATILFDRSSGRSLRRIMFSPSGLLARRFRKNVVTLNSANSRLEITSLPKCGFILLLNAILIPARMEFMGTRQLRGPDNIVGTYDDPMEANNHPFQPRYLYRVVASEEIR